MTDEFNHGQRSDEELGRLLGAAFDAQARHDVADAAVPPPPRFATPAVQAARPAGRRLARLAAPLSAAAAVIAIVLIVLGISSSGGGPNQATGSRTAAALGTGRAASVHIKLLNDDGATYGVGMPVIAYFSRRITDARPLQRVTTVTVDGKPAQGAWYFEPSKAHKGYPIEAHFRLENYWPAYAKIRVDLPVRGISAGGGMRYDDDLTLNFDTGPRNIFTVDDVTHQMTVTSNGRTVGRYAVSLGAPGTPTQHGIKVIMEMGNHICISGPGYHLCNVEYAQRLTYAGEFLLAAPPGNLYDIRHGIDSSNGCTNLTLAAARQLYKISEVGDVVQYPNVIGPDMHLGQGYGDWNVSWSNWLTGGLVPTH